MNSRLIVFAKAPVPGRVKTRLAKSIGASAAADLYRAFLEDMFAMLDADRTTWDVELHVDDNSPYFQRFRTRIRLQQGANLGDKIFHALAEALDDGAPVAAVLGSDAPTLKAGAVQELLRATADITLGPTPDGGYWGIAARRVHREMFNGVPWSSAQTLQETRKGCEKCGLSVALASACWDVDDLEDLNRLRESPDMGALTAGVLARVAPPEGTAEG